MGAVPESRLRLHYRREAEIGNNGRILVKKAWWEINSADPDGKPTPGSPADTITRIFNWIGNEGHSIYWVTNKLNEEGIKSQSGGEWAQESMRYIMMNHCYTGQHKYNARMMVPNPKRPLGDITGAVKRTLLRSKPDGEAIGYKIPPLISEDLWLRANRAIKERGRGHGKEGKVIEALLRNRIFCPKCGKPLIVRRRGGSDKHYYLCSRKTRSSEKEHCTYRTFVPGAWDESVWDCVYAILKQDGWIEEKLAMTQKQNYDIDKMIKMEQTKILQAKTRITKVREGFEGGPYDLDEAKSKVNGYLEIIKKAEQEINRLNEIVGDHTEVKQ